MCLFPWCWEGVKGLHVNVKNASKRTQCFFYFMDNSPEVSYYNLNS